MPFSTQRDSDNHPWYWPLAFFLIAFAILVAVTALGVGSDALVKINKHVPDLSSEMTALSKKTVAQLEEQKVLQEKTFSNFNELLKKKLGISLDQLQEEQSEDILCNLDLPGRLCVSSLIVKEKAEVKELRSKVQYVDDRATINKLTSNTINALEIDGGNMEIDKAFIKDVNAGALRVGGTPVDMVPFTSAIRTISDTVASANSKVNQAIVNTDTLSQRLDRMSDQVIALTSISNGRDRYAQQEEAIKSLSSRQEYVESILNQCTLEGRSLFNTSPAPPLCVAFSTLRTRVRVVEEANNMFIEKSSDQQRRLEVLENYERDLQRILATTGMKTTGEFTTQQSTTGQRPADLTTGVDTTIVDRHLWKEDWEDELDQWPFLFQYLRDKSENMTEQYQTLKFRLTENMVQSEQNQQMLQETRVITDLLQEEVVQIMAIIDSIANNMKDLSKNCSAICVISSSSSSSSGKTSSTTSFTDIVEISKINNNNIDLSKNDVFIAFQIDLGNVNKTVLLLQNNQGVLMDRVDKLDGNVKYIMDQGNLTPKRTRSK